MEEKLDIMFPDVRLPKTQDGFAVLLEDWTVIVPGWMLRVPALTETDGASIPRFLWRVCGHPLAVPRVYAALVHDWLYSGGGPDEITRGEADEIYRTLLVRFGWGRVRASVEFYALRLFGASHWTNKGANK